MSGTVLSGSLPARQRALVEQWRRQRLHELLADWERVEQNELPQPIEPLS